MVSCFWIIIWVDFKESSCLYILSLSISRALVILSCLSILSFSNLLATLSVFGGESNKLTVTIQTQIPKIIISNDLGKLSGVISFIGYAISKCGASLNDFQSPPHLIFILVDLIAMAKFLKFLMSQTRLPALSLKAISNALEGY